MPEVKPAIKIISAVEVDEERPGWGDKHKGRVFGGECYWLGGCLKNKKKCLLAFGDDFFDGFFWGSQANPSLWAEKGRDRL